MKALLAFAIGLVMLVSTTVVMGYGYYIGDYYVRNVIDDDQIPEGFEDLFPFPVCPDMFIDMDHVFSNIDTPIPTDSTVPKWSITNIPTPSYWPIDTDMHLPEGFVFDSITGVSSLA